MTTVDPKSEKAKIHYSLVLGYSNAENNKTEEFLRAATKFCGDVVEIVTLNCSEF